GNRHPRVAGAHGRCRAGLRDRPPAPPGKNCVGLAAARDGLAVHIGGHWRGLGNSRRGLLGLPSCPAGLTKCFPAIPNVSPIGRPVRELASFGPTSPPLTLR